MSELGVFHWVYSIAKFRFLYDAILFDSVCPQFSPTPWGEKDGRRFDPTFHPWFSPISLTDIKRLRLNQYREF